MHGKQEGDSTGGLIPYKNPPALIGYYVAILSLLPIPFLGIVAVVCGVMGLRKYKANPIIKGVVHAWIGIVLGGMTTIGYGLITLLVIVASVTS